MSNSVCSICFSEFTVSGSHRIVSLKCGHIFGQECIEKWVSSSKKSNCPTCHATIRKSHLRIIFATEILAFDNKKEEELLEKYLRETEKTKILQKNIDQLKNEIEILKHNLLKYKKEEEVEDFSIPIKFYKSIKFNYKINNTIIDFDHINNFLLISGYEGNKYFLFKYNLNDNNLQSLEVEGKITDMKLSPYNDGLLLFCYSNYLKLLNVVNFNIIMEKRCENKISSVCFDNFDREFIFFGDFKGIFYSLNLISYSLKSIKISNTPLNNIVQTNNFLYTSTYFNLYEINYLELINISNALIMSESDNVPMNYINPDTNLCNEINIVKNGICTFLSCFDDEILVSIRNKENYVNFYKLGKNQLHYYLKIKQIKKFQNIIFGKNIYFIDNLNGFIGVYNFDQMKFSHKIKFKDEICNFCIRNKILFVLLNNHIDIFKA